jgi:hypothetical protein
MSAPQTTQAPKAEPPSKPGRLRVSREEFGERWPLTVDAGELECRQKGAGPAGRMVLFHAEGRTYAVNGTAITHSGHPRIDPIWRDNPDIPGTKIPITPLLNAGLKLCE